MCIFHWTYCISWMHRWPATKQESSAINFLTHNVGSFVHRDLSNVYFCCWHHCRDIWYYWSQESVYYGKYDVRYTHGKHVIGCHAIVNGKTTLVIIVGLEQKSSVPNGKLKSSILSLFNPLAPGWCSSKSIRYKLIIQNSSVGTRYEIPFSWMS